MGPTWYPNRIFDAEALRKPLGGLLERSWSALGGSWSALGALTGGRLIHRIFGESSSRARVELEETQAAARGGIREG